MQAHCPPGQTNLCGSQVSRWHNRSWRCACLSKRIEAVFGSGICSIHKYIEALFHWCEKDLMITVACENSCPEQLRSGIHLMPDVLSQKHLRLDEDVLWLELAACIILSGLMPAAAYFISKYTSTFNAAGQ